MTYSHGMFCFLWFQLIYLKVTALLFPTSDFRHPVTTPALLYISQALTKVHAAVSVFVIVCAVGAVFDCSCPLSGFHHLSFCLNPALVLSLVILYFFLVHFLWIRRSFSSVRLKHFQLLAESFQIKTTAWSYAAEIFIVYVAVLFNISSYLCVSLWFARPQCQVRSLQDVTSGLVLCCLAVEYVSFSKRFLPELVNFLAGTLHLAVQDKALLGTYTFHTSTTHVTVGSIWKTKQIDLAGFL